MSPPPLGREPGAAIRRLPDLQQFALDCPRWPNAHPAMDHLSQIVRILFTPVLLAEGAGAVTAVAVVTRPMARRLGISRRLAAATLLATAALLVLTAPIMVLRALPRLGDVWDTSRALTWWRRGWISFTFGPSDLEGWLNVALFVPVAWCWALVSRRPGPVLATLVALSAAIETTQAGLLVRVADPHDLYTNSMGAAAGVAGAILMLASRNTPRRQLPATVAARLRGPRVTMLVASAVAATVAVLIIGTALLQRAADREQQELLAALTTSYQGTTADEVYQAARDGSVGQFSFRSGRSPDYLGEVDAGVVEARFSLAGARPRCVVVRWAEEPAAFTLARGSACRGFRDVGVPVD